MKQKIKMLIMSAMAMVIMTLTTGCAVELTATGPDHYRTRHVWVGELYYEQVYYYDGSHQMIVVSQTPVNNNRYDNGRRRHGNRRRNR